MGRGGNNREPKRLEIRRHRDWEVRLAAALEEARSTPFVWGEFDCALAMADMVVAMTGVDPAKRFRGRYKTARGAAGALRRYGAGTLEATMTALFGEPVPRAFGRRGDAASVPLDADLDDRFRTAAGIVGLDGVSVHVAAPARGLIRLPLRLATCAWRVG